VTPNTGPRRFLVVRHGETEANTVRRYMGQQDSPLTPRGERQIEAVARRLAGHSFAALYASDLGRAARTAEAIARASGADIRFDERLRERRSGVLEGLIDQEARRRYPEVFAQLDALDPDVAIPNGESAADVRARVASFVAEKTASHPGKTTLVVAHGGISRAFLWHLLDLPFRAARWARCDNTSLSSFVWRHGMWLLETWNDTSHLVCPSISDPARSDES